MFYGNEYVAWAVTGNLGKARQVQRRNRQKETCEMDGWWNLK